MVHDGSHRLQWAGLPPHVREWIEATIGGAVVQAAGQTGGYGPGMASRCELADGRRYFVKAASPAQNPDTPDMMRGEAAINGVLAAATPTPRLLHTFDDGEWVVLVFDDIEGREPGDPWTDNDLYKVAELSRQVSRAIGDSALPTIGERYASVFTGWRTLRDDDGEGLTDAWCREHLSELAELEAGWEEVVSGDSLVHGDFRSDNILLAGDQAYLVDWTATCRGAPWFDLLTILPSIELGGGGSPEHVLEVFQLEVPRTSMTKLVAAFAGYFAQRSQLPDPPGLPTVRAFQRAQGEVTVSWLRRLTGWE